MLASILARPRPAAFGCAIAISALLPVASACAEPTALERAVLDEFAGGRRASLAELCRQVVGVSNASAGASARCALSGSFIRQVVTHARGYETGADEVIALDLDNAEIDGSIDLADVLIDRPIRIDRGTIEGDVDVSGAKATRSLALSSLKLDGEFKADGLVADLGLSLSRVAISEPHGVSLRNAGIKGGADLRGLSGAGITGPGLQVDGSLDLTLAQLGKVELPDARIAGSLILNGASAREAVDLDRIQIDSTFFAKPMMVGCSPLPPRFGRLNMARARIAMDAQMNGVEARGKVDLAAARVGRDLSLKSQAADQGTEGCSLPDVPARYGGVELHYADVQGSLLMDGAEITGDLTGVELKVSGDVSARDMHFDRDVTLANASIGGNLDIQGATLSDLDLSGATVSGTLHLADDATGDGQPSQALRWIDQRSRSGLTLTNAHVGILAGALQAPPNRGKLHLSGTTISHVPPANQAMTKDWDEWIRLDTRYVPSIYEQIASAVRSAGFGDKADDIRFEGRVRQMDEQTGGDWWVSLALRYVAGFGIGTYAFRVLWWIVGVTVAGAVYLRWLSQWSKENRTAPPSAVDHRCSLVWCLGAALSRLLPGIEVNEEFSEFFKDPERERLTGRETFAFSMIGLLGWLLGIILVGALTGLFGRA